MRTVWVNGIRHAILSDDDPLVNLKPRKRTKARAPKEKESLKFYKPDNHRFVEMQVVVEKSEAEQVTEVMSEDDIPEQITTIAEERVEFRMDEIMKYMRSYKWEKEEREEALFPIPKSPKSQDLDSNPLSERVLQWLDLCGRSVDYDFDEKNRVQKKKKRIQKQKSPKTSQEVTMSFMFKSDVRRERVGSEDEKVRVYTRKASIPGY